MLKKKLVPPEGGWGWVIMFAYALYNLIFIPIMQNFGLIFKDTFALMGMSATDGTIIITSNAAVSMITGLINGPLLRRFSYRKISIASSIFIIIGIVSTSFATKFSHFVITYGLITSLGVGLGMSSYALALNSYFFKRRSKATGFAFTITGIGPILMPQLISFLLSNYTVQGTVLIVGGIAANTMIAALLLQPVKWHMIEEVEEADDENEDGQEKVHENGIENKKGESDRTLLRNGSVDIPRFHARRRSSIIDSNMSIDHDAETQSIYGFDTNPRVRINSTSSAVGNRRRRASTSLDIKPSHLEPIKNKWWSSAHSINSVNLGSSVKIFDEHERNFKKINEDQEETTTSSLLPQTEPIYNPNLSITYKSDEKQGKFSKFLDSVVHFFDLSLLQDPIYVNIMLGMSFAIFAELNFSLLTPFILADIGLDTQRIATFLSVLSIADLFFRFLAPFIGDYLKKDARVMYLISLLMLISTRFSLLFFSTFKALLFVAVGLGVAKGIRTVYMTLVIPNYVPLERLASASGLQMVVNGVFILAGGPVLGVIRDISGSYTKCIYVINCVTITTVIMWTAELIYRKIKTSSKDNEVQVEKG